VEILDDLTVNLDGSGTFKYTINLSSSKVKVNSILKLDSLDGKKVPKLPEIKSRINEFKLALAKQPGISNVKIETNDVEFIVKLQCDFSNLINLQEGIKNAILSFNSELLNNESINHNWVSINGNKLVRAVPNLSLKRLSEIKQGDLDLLKTGTYTTISRFAKTVQKTDNTSASISKSGMAVMLKANMYSLTKNPKLLENTIYLNQKYFVKVSY
jgi:hypothetical protein